MKQEDESILEIKNPHDKLFKLVFGDVGNLADFMRSNLPENLTANMDLESLEIVPGSYLEEDFTDNFNDLLARVKIRDGMLEIYFLFEHKSSYEPDSPWQILRYMARQWKKDLQENKTFAPIVPVLFCHAGKKWEYQTFSVLFPGFPEIFLEYIPKFQYILHDIAGIPDNEIKGGTLVRLVQILMKDATSGRLKEKVSILGKSLQEIERMKSGRYWTEIIIRYIMRVEQISYDVLREEFRKGKFLFGEEIVMKTLEEVRQKARREGREQGLEKGIEQEKLETARRMKAKGLPVADILEFTGLTREKLREAGLLES